MSSVVKPENDLPTSPAPTNNVPPSRQNRLAPVFHLAGQEAAVAVAAYFVTAQVLRQSQQAEVVEGDRPPSGADAATHRDDVPAAQTEIFVVREKQALVAALSRVSFCARSSS